jgi:hypothetical protein
MSRSCQYPGVAAKAPVQNSSAVATVQNEQRVYVTRSDRGTWLFVPDPNGGSNS